MCGQEEGVLKPWAVQVEFQLFLSHFLSQDKGQKSSAYRKTHKLVKGLLTSIEHHNLKAMTRTSSGAVVTKYKIQYPLL